MYAGLFEAYRERNTNARIDLDVTCGWRARYASLQFMQVSLTSEY
jgi:hypothetical protein